MSLLSIAAISSGCARLPVRPEPARLPAAESAPYDCRGLFERAWVDSLREEHLPKEPTAMEYGLAERKGDPEGHEKQADEVAIEIEKLKDLARRSARLSQQELNAFASEWVTSDVHATYLYMHLGEFPESMRGPLLDALIANNPFYEGAIRLPWLPHSLMTFSFEKESSWEQLTLYYRPESIPEDKWLETSPEERAKEILMTSGRILPTSFCPRSLGKLKGERNADGEVTSAAFAIRPEAVLRQMGQVMVDLQEAIGYHVHAVIDIPAPDGGKYTAFFKLENDRYLIKSLLEGLLPSDFATTPTSHVNNRSRVSLNEIPRGWKLLFLGSRVSGDAWNTNYGPAPEGMKRMGGELRDVALTFKEWRAELERLSLSLLMQAWTELPTIEELRSGGQPQLLDRIPLARTPQQILGYPSGNVITNLFGVRYLEKEVMELPLVEYEKTRFYSSASHTWVTPTPEQAKRFKEARGNYIESLSALGIKLNGLINRRQQPSDDALQGAISLLLQDWAKQSGIAEFFP